jgi:predicted porin
LAAAYASNFITFAGTEDLGSGMKASFKVEEAMTFNAATLGTGNRESWVGLSGAFGDIKAGTQYTNIFFTVVPVDPNGFNNIAGWGPATAMGDASAINSNDVITYTLPKLVEGLNISFQSFRPTNTTTASSAGLNYTVGALSAAWANQIAGADKTSAYGLSYNFGVAKVGFSNIDANIAAVKTTDNTYVISAPIGEAFSLAYSAGTYKKAAASTKNSQLGAYYNISKRTAAYVNYGSSSATGSATSVTALGINHAFYSDAGLGQLMVLKSKTPLWQHSGVFLTPEIY